MAKKKEDPKAVIERNYNVPLRKEFLKVPKYKRAKKAVKALKEFISKHMKSDNVKIGKYLNEHLWKHGIKNPPHHVKVTAKKDDKGLVNVEMEGAPVEVKKKEPKKPTKIEKELGKLEKKTEEIKKKDEPKGEEAKEDKTAVKVEERKEIKLEEKPKVEVKKEVPKVDEKVEVKPKAQVKPKVEEKK